mgnify:CR=1 FL=1
MKENKRNSNSVNKSLKVIITNPPSKEEAKELIKKVSRIISNLYSQKTNELEEIKWKQLKMIMILIYLYQVRI